MYCHHYQWWQLHKARGRGARAPTFTNRWARGHSEWKNSKQETDQSVLTITKALTKTTNCAFRAKRGGAWPKKISGAGSEPPTFKIRSGITDQYHHHQHYHWNATLSTFKSRLQTLLYSIARDIMTVRFINFTINLHTYLFTSSEDRCKGALSPLTQLS